MRLLLVVLAGLMLSACNVVMSEQPLFHDAEARRAPLFKDGRWVSLSAECLAGWTDPKAEPPDCARHGEVRGGRLIVPEDDAQDVIVAGGGDPLIVQIRFSEKEAATGKPFTVYIYGAIQPTARDADGRVTEARRWLALCGPPPPAAKGSSLNQWEHLTEHPLPGVAIDKKLGVCRARNAAAVRRAARASEAWDDEKAVMRWIGRADPAP